MRQFVAFPLSPVAALARVQSDHKRHAGSACKNRNEEETMNRYEIPVPRVVFGIAAVVMTALTISVSVVLPAKMDSNSRERPTLAASKVTTPASTGVVTNSSSIDVVAVREQGLSTVPCIWSKPNHTPEG
jgi:hypothetical protein